MDSISNAAATPPPSIKRYYLAAGRRDLTEVALRSKRRKCIAAGLDDVVGGSSAGSVGGVRVRATMHIALFFLFPCHADLTIMVKSRLGRRIVMRRSSAVFCICAVCGPPCHDRCALFNRFEIV